MRKLKVRNLMPIVGKEGEERRKGSMRKQSPQLGAIKQKL